MAYQDGYLVLDSMRSCVVLFDHAGIRRIVPLEGWLRGAAVTADDRLLVAGGPHRLVSRKAPRDVADEGLRDAVRGRLSCRFGERTLTAARVEYRPIAPHSAGSAGMPAQGHMGGPSWTSPR